MDASWVYKPVIKSLDIAQTIPKGKMRKNWAFSANKLFAKAYT
jgi:hypothetical protein